MGFPVRMQAKFAGRCTVCNARKAAGEDILYFGPGNGIKCPECAQAPQNVAEWTIGDGPILNQQFIGGGINGANIGTINGTKVIFKIQNEMSTYREHISRFIADAMNIRVPKTEIRRNDPVSPHSPIIIQEFIGEDSPINVPDADVAVFDMVIGNNDRHDGNFVYTKGGKMPIDHGICLPGDGRAPYYHPNTLRYSGKKLPDGAADKLKGFIKRSADIADEAAKLNMESSVLWAINRAATMLASGKYLDING